MSLYLRNMVPEKDAVIEAVMALPAMHRRKRPTVEAAAKEALKVLEGGVVEFMRGELLEDIQDAYDMYVLTNGERASAADPDEWDSGIDDEVEALLEPYQEALSADWLGRFTINTRLDEPYGVDRIVKAAGTEVFKQLSDKKSPNQTLAACGIVMADIEEALAAHLGQEQEEPPMLNDAEINADLAAVIEKLFAHVGTEFDEKAVRGDVELMMDMDDEDGILANGAAARIGLDENDVFTLQMVNLDHPTDALDSVMAQLKKRKTNRPAKNERLPEQPQGEPMNAQAVVLVKTHSGVGDTDMSKALGVSRTAYTNWAKGTAEFRPNEDQKATLRAQIVADVNGLLQALAIVDGAEAMAVS